MLLSTHYATTMQIPCNKTSVGYTTSLVTSYKKGDNHVEPSSFHSSPFVHLPHPSLKHKSIKSLTLSIMKRNKPHHSRMAQLVRSLETMKASFSATMHAIETFSQTTHEFAKLSIADNAAYASSTRPSTLQRSAGHRKGARVDLRITYSEPQKETD